VCSFRGTGKMTFILLFLLIAFPSLLISEIKYLLKFH
jgi:hypothetical protein